MTQEHTTRQEMTPVEQRIMAELNDFEITLDIISEIKAFIYNTARYLLGTSFARAHELSYKLVEYY
jgi:hypothetical protein